MIGLAIVGIGRAGIFSGPRCNGRRDGWLPGLRTGNANAEARLPASDETIIGH
jgi:hypothetical protein